MIDIASRAKTASRNCTNALGQDYYVMLTKKKDVEDEMLGVLELLCEASPVTQADLKCQFPNHEKMLASIRTCAKLVLCKILTVHSYIKDPPPPKLVISPLPPYSIMFIKYRSANKLRKNVLVINRPP